MQLSSWQASLLLWLVLCGLTSSTPRLFLLVQSRSSTRLFGSLFLLLQSRPSTRLFLLLQSHLSHATSTQLLLNSSALQ
jgi:hypothetical protein